MFYRRRASPKHRYDITEVDYGGGGGAPHMAKRSMINLCFYGVPPVPVYKGVEEGEGRPSLWRALGESSHRE